MPGPLLAGRVAWVTAGTGGLGLAIARALAAVGADLAIGALPPEAALPEGVRAARAGHPELRIARAAIEAAGVRCFAAPLDLRSTASVDAFHAAATQALGPVAILVNAAGAVVEQPLGAGSDAGWLAVLELALSGAFRTTRRCLPAMLAAGWGRIIQIGAAEASVGWAGHGAYCAAKQGLLGLTRCVALEGAMHGVTCNTVSPAAAVAEALAEEPVGPKVAGFVLYLCSEEARGLTGENLFVAREAAR
jgi:NAD(P)-dependent dehydrogenase (short-subunit alcohol dehydrogenase family)